MEVILNVLTYTLLLLTIKFLSTHSADVDYYISQMTVGEKVGQMVQIDISYFMENSQYDSVNYTKLENYIKTYKIGSILNSPFSQGKLNDNSKSGLKYLQCKNIMIYDL